MMIILIHRAVLIIKLDNFRHLHDCNHHHLVHLTNFLPLYHKLPVCLKMDITYGLATISKILFQCLIVNT